MTPCEGPTPTELLKMFCAFGLGMSFIVGSLGLTIRLISRPPWK